MVRYEPGGTGGGWVIKMIQKHNVFFQIHGRDTIMTRPTQPKARYLSVPLTIMIAGIAIIIIGWVGCMGFNFMLMSFSLIYGKIEGVSGWLTLLLSYFLIGIFFPITMLPGRSWVVCLLFPPTYTIDLTRHLVLSTDLILGSLTVEILSLCFLNVILVLTGLKLFEKADRRVRQGGLKF